eukprot:RCo034739
MGNVAIQRRGELRGDGTLEGVSPLEDPLPVTQEDLAGGGLRDAERGLARRGELQAVPLDVHRDRPILPLVGHNKGLGVAGKLLPQLVHVAVHVLEVGGRLVELIEAKPLLRHARGIDAVLCSVQLFHQVLEFLRLLLCPSSIDLFAGLFHANLALVEHRAIWLVPKHRQRQRNAEPVHQAGVGVHDKLVVAPGVSNLCKLKEIEEDVFVGIRGVVVVRGSYTKTLICSRTRRHHLHVHGRAVGDVNSRAVQVIRQLEASVAVFQFGELVAPLRGAHSLVLGGTIVPHADSLQSAIGLKVAKRTRRVPLALLVLLGLAVITADHSCVDLVVLPLPPGVVNELNRGEAVWVQRNQSDLLVSLGGRNRHRKRLGIHRLHVGFGLLFA